MSAELIPWGAVAAIGVAAIAGAVKLVQLFVKRYDDGKVERAQRKCPHWVPFELPDGRVGYKNLFTSPPFTTSWICSGCGLTTHDRWIVEHIVQESVKKRLKKIGVRGPVRIEPL